MRAENSNTIWCQLRNGDPDALLGLYREHYVGLLNYGLKLSGDHQLTRDCITQMLLNLHRNHKRLPDVMNCRSYLLTSLRNEIFGDVRLRKRRHELEQHLAQNDNECSYEELLIARQSVQEEKERLRQAMGDLSPREKELLKMRYFDDRSYDEIAAECGISKRTAYNIINAALKRMKVLLIQQSRNKMIFISLINMLVHCIL
jgi:RNA polymerase sigma factor (sigma-70 family)